MEKEWKSRCSSGVILPLPKIDFCIVRHMLQIIYTLSTKHEVIKVSATATSELSLDCGLCISDNVFELDKMENPMGPSKSTQDMRQLEVSIMCITTIIMHHSGKSLGKNV